MATANAYDTAAASANASKIAPYPSPSSWNSQSHQSRLTSGIPISPLTPPFPPFPPFPQFPPFPPWASFYLRDALPIEKETNPNKASKTILDVFI